MFRTSNCSSSSGGVLYKQLKVFHRASFKMHGEMLMMNNYLFETCRG